MARIRSFNLDRWSEPDEQRRVRHIGMADARETFEKLKKHLEATGLLPDEYFLFDGEYETQLKGELPNFDHALCVPNYGASEGIYLDISLVCRNEDGSRKFIPFATGKTLEESGDAFLRMHRIAGECSLLLNGRGIYFERSETPLFLTSEELSIKSYKSPALYTSTSFIALTPPFSLRLRSTRFAIYMPKQGGVL